MRLRAAAIALALSALGGCFSADDFSPCTEAGQCGVDGEGLALMCLDGQCVRPSIEGREVVTLSGALGSLHAHAGRAVIIEAVDLNESVLRVDAESIVVEGPIRGSGHGLPGGDGGIGGQDAPGADGAQGQPSRSETAGGGLGGVGGQDGPGAAGSGGRHPVEEPCRITFDIAQPGSGGGGGGGARGMGDAVGCDGGPGGKGGAAIVLRASRFIEIRAPLEAAGQLGGDAPAESCADPGGAGGGGSGGLIYLEAPVILFSDGSRLDVRGADGAGGGLVTVYGAIEGSFPGVHGAIESGVCLR